MSVSANTTRLWVFNYHQYKQNEVNSVRECCAKNNNEQKCRLSDIDSSPNVSELALNQWSSKYVGIVARFAYATKQILFSFICLRLVLLASNIKVYRIAMSVISSHSLLSRQILLWPPFKEIENNNCFKIYPARSDLKKSERKPLKHDYLEFLIDRSINAWKAFMLPETGSWHVQKLDIFTEFSNMVITVSILSSTASKNRKRIIKTFNCCPCHLR